MTLPDQMRPFSAPATEPVTHVSPSRLAALLRAEHALSQIASTSPCMLNPGRIDEQRCNLCLAHINHARDALGEEHWPAIPHTPVASPSAPDEQPSQPGEPMRPIAVLLAFAVLILAGCAERTAEQQTLDQWKADHPYAKMESSTNPAIASGVLPVHVYTDSIPRHDFAGLSIVNRVTYEHRRYTVTTNHQYVVQHVAIERNW